MTPSVTLSVSAETPSFLAARPMSRARTSAPAMRSAVPLCSIDWLPAVCPSLGVRPVSPEIIVTRPSGTSSSSAAIWASAVTMPCPSSTLPVNTVTLPSALMGNQASSLRWGCRLPGGSGGAEPAERGHLVSLDRADRRHAGASSRAVDQHRAGAALRHAAAVFGAIELEIVAQHVEQRRVRLGIDRARRPVDLQADGHCGSPRRWQRRGKAWARGWRAELTVCFGSRADLGPKAGFGQERTLIGSEMYGAEGAPTKSE